MLKFFLFRLRNFRNLAYNSSLLERTETWETPGVVLGE